MSQCPICAGKLRSVKWYSYFESTCAGTNHTIRFYTDIKTNNITKLKCSLNPEYTQFIEFDFDNKECRVICYKNSIPYYINIPKMLIPDFPDLISLKDKVATYVALS